MDEHEGADADRAQDEPPPELRPGAHVGEAGHRRHVNDAIATIVVLVVLATSAALLAWRRGVEDEAQCRAHFDRWTELRIRQAEPTVAGAELEHRKQEARSTAERGDAYARCVEHADRDALLCGEHANSIDELERCFP